MERLDLISKLPLPILDHILSLLAIKDAAKTSVLSKTWNSAWNSLSSLEFGPENFGSPYYVSYVFVDQILAKRQKHKISIQRFNMIYFPNYLNVDNWFKILVECNIKELWFEFATRYPGKRLPEVIFAAKALNVLHLGGFKIELPSNGVKFSSLKELHLVNSFLDEQLLKAICTIL
ncbi:putative rop guanine nucleotide exchange factor 12-like [Capsicum annuum]|nr:putative rop guanine nucleotide exchange factor 12-like [Capsicum annuum]